MKTLFLMRHAKSSWANSNQADFDRPLNNRGMNDAPAMGKMMLKKGELPELMISSPALRARTTAELFAGETGLQVKYDENIYEASMINLLQLIRSFNDQYSSLMLVGHNPVLTHSVEYFTGELLDNLPTAGIIKFSFDVEKWSDIGEGEGKLVWVRVPKDPSF